MRDEPSADKSEPAEAGDRESAESLGGEARSPAEVKSEVTSSDTSGKDDPTPEAAADAAIDASADHEPSNEAGAPSDVEVDSEAPDAQGGDEPARGPDMQHVQASIDEGVGKILEEFAKKLRFGRAEDNADANHLIVAAASIIAKAERDRLFRAIAARYEPEYGELQGWGYVNPKTNAFIDAYYIKTGTYPSEMRRKWRRQTTAASGQ